MVGNWLSLPTLSLWVLSVLVESGGQLAFKAAARESSAENGLDRWYRMAVRPWLWVGISCYVFEFVIWLAFLSLVPLSLGVMLGSINIVVIMIFGRLLFKERLTSMRVLGILLISLGVGIVGLQV